MASKRRIRRHSCERKRRYDNEGYARAAVHHVMNTRGIPLNVYRCQFCGGWHVGHNPEQMRGKVHVWLRERRKG